MSPRDRGLDDETITRLRLVVMQLSRRLRRHGPSDLPPAQLSALGVLSGLGPLSIRALAEQENVQSPTMTRIVDALEAGGWVRRTTSPSDARVSMVRTTPKAERQMARLRAQRNAFLAERITRLSATDAARIVAALPALERLLADDTPAG